MVLFCAIRRPPSFVVPHPPPTWIQLAWRHNSWCPDGYPKNGMISQDFTRNCVGTLEPPMLTLELIAIWWIIWCHSWSIQNIYPLHFGGFSIFWWFQIMHTPCHVGEPGGHAPHLRQGLIFWRCLKMFEDVWRCLKMFEDLVVCETQWGKPPPLIQCRSGYVSGAIFQSIPRSQRHENMSKVSMLSMFHGSRIEILTDLTAWARSKVRIRLRRSAAVQLCSCAAHSLA